MKVSRLKFEGDGGSNSVLRFARTCESREYVRKMDFKTQMGRKKDLYTCSLVEDRNG